jgi:hypothetical protein
MHGQAHRERLQLKAAAATLVQVCKHRLALLRWSVVPPRPWSRNPIEVVGKGGCRPLRRKAAVTVWAAWCAEAIDCLDEIDDESFKKSIRGVSA